jgi:hypothetical protein
MSAQSKPIESRFAEFEIEPGTALLFDHQQYRCVAFAPYEKFDGIERTVAIWESRCAECGRGFTIITVLGGIFSPSRRCELHKRPGKAAFPKQRRTA